MDTSSWTPYPSDLTDARWELIAPMVAPRSGGRPPIHSRRRIVDAILYVNRTGCSWRQLPHDFRRGTRCTGTSRPGNQGGVTDRIHDALRAAVHFPTRKARKQDKPSVVGVTRRIQLHSLRPGHQAKRKAIGATPVGKNRPVEGLDGTAVMIESIVGF